MLGQRLRKPQQKQLQRVQQRQAQQQAQQALLFCRKRRGQQQPTKMPTGLTCSFEFSLKGYMKTISGNCCG
jgi:hypothetical protein